MAPVLAVLVVSALLPGCATPQMKQVHVNSHASLQANSLDTLHTASLPTQAGVASVPFFAQKEYACGPASLAMVFSAAGLAVTPQDLLEQVYLPARKGSLQVEMLAATRRQGLLALTLPPSMSALLQEVAAGHPVLVLQNLSLPVYPVWHYAVVVGYDLERNTLTLHSGETERLEMSAFTFERTWARGNYWAMLALPPGQLPASDDAPHYARSAAALEAQHPKAARLAYAAGLARWPQDAWLHLGLGNTAYALHDLDAAAAAYQAALQWKPDFADAWNNLAQTQLDRGQHQAAKAAIARAVQLGGERLEDYLALRAQIENAALP